MPGRAPGARFRRVACAQATCASFRLRPEWVAGLPNGKLPDREDFRRYVDDPQARAVAWTRAVQESARLRDEFARWLERGNAQDVLPLP